MSPRKKARRVRYPAQASSIWNVLEQNQTLSPEEIDTLDTGVTQALAALSTGLATVEHWATLVDAANLCIKFDEMGIDLGGHLPDVQSSYAALGEAYDRHEQHGVWGLSGPGMMATRTLVDVHFAALQQCTRSAWIRAIRAVEADVQRARCTTGAVLVGHTIHRAAAGGEVAA